MNESTILEKMKKLYGFSEGNLEFIPTLEDLCMCINQSVVLLDYKRDESGKWSNEVFNVKILEISDYDPLTVTYKLKYLQDDNTKEARILPEGFSFENPEETGKSLRFIPYSFYWRLREKSLFFESIKEKYEDLKTLSIQSLMNISQSKEKEKILSYCCSIYSIIKLENSGEILCFRITNIKLKHNKQKEYAVTISNDKGKTYTFLINSEDSSYKFKYGIELIGNMKIIDLSDI